MPAGVICIYTEMIHDQVTFGYAVVNGIPGYGLHLLIMAVVARDKELPDFTLPVQ